MHEVTNTNLAKLDALTDRHIRKWLKMPPSGTMAVVHSYEDLNIKTLAHIYKESHAISHATSRMKADSIVNRALTSRPSREEQWTRKGSVTVYCEDQFSRAVESPQPKQFHRKEQEKSKTKIKKNINDEVRKCGMNTSSH